MPVAPLERRDLGARGDHAAACRQHTPIAGDERLDLDLSGRGIVKRAGDPPGIENGHERSGARAIELAPGLGFGTAFGALPRQSRKLPGWCNHEQAALGQQGAIAPGRRRSFEERAAGAGQRPHHGVAGMRREHRDRAAARMTGKFRLALEQHDEAMRRQPGGDRQAGNAAADDREVEARLHHVEKLHRRPRPVNAGVVRGAVL